MAENMRKGNLRNGGNIRRFRKNFTKIFLTNIKGMEWNKKSEEVLSFESFYFTFEKYFYQLIDLNISYLIENFFHEVQKRI